MQSVSPTRFFFCSSIPASAGLASTSKTAQVCYPGILLNSPSRVRFKKAEQSECVASPVLTSSLPSPAPVPTGLGLKVLNSRLRGVLRSWTVRKLVSYLNSPLFSHSVTDIRAESASVLLRFAFPFFSKKVKKLKAANETLTKRRTSTHARFLQSRFKWKRLKRTPRRAERRYERKVPPVRCAF